MTRADHIMIARVYLREARARRQPHQRSFRFLLLQWAANRRLLAAHAAAEPKQRELFA